MPGASSASKVPPRSQPAVVLASVGADKKVAIEKSFDFAGQTVKCVNYICIISHSSAIDDLSQQSN